MGSPVGRVERALARAILAEVEGQHFYLMAAQSTQDEKGRQVFTLLAREEVLHQNFLRAQADALRRTGAPDRQVVLPTPEPLPAEDPIFSSELRGRLAQAHFEMTALSVGLQLENNAERFYRTEARGATDEFVKQFFNQLADWESGHAQALLRQQESLKETYWTAGGFAPF